jgi:hypothetical protein
MANWGYLRYIKWSPNTRKVFKRFWRVRGKNLCVHGEDAKRLLAYSPNTPKEIKVCISRLIIMRIKNILDSFQIHYMGWFKPKNHLTLLPFKGIWNIYLWARDWTNLFSKYWMVKTLSKIIKYYDPRRWNKIITIEVIVTLPFPSRHIVLFYYYCTFRSTIHTVPFSIS